MCLDPSVGRLWRKSLRHTVRVRQDSVEPGTGREKYGVSPETSGLFPFLSDFTVSGEEQKEAYEWRTPRADGDSVSYTGLRRVLNLVAKPSASSTKDRTASGAEKQDLQSLFLSFAVFLSDALVQTLGLSGALQTDEAHPDVDKLTAGKLSDS